MTQGSTIDSNERASEGWLKSSTFEGSIDTHTVTYRQSRDVTLDGLQPAPGGGFMGIQILFPPSPPSSPISLPLPWPNTVEVRYFRQTSGGLRTSYPSQSGTLDLTFDEPQAHATGSFDFLALFDGVVHTFKGSFDIRWV